MQQEISNINLMLSSSLYL